MPGYQFPDSQLNEGSVVLLVRLDVVGVWPGYHLIAVADTE